MGKSMMTGFGRLAQNFAVMAFFLMACGTAAAKDLTWTGATDMNWDTSTANWVQTGTTTPATFADGDNVLQAKNITGLQIIFR